MSRTRKPRFDRKLRTLANDFAIEAARAKVRYDKAVIADEATIMSDSPEYVRTKTAEERAGALYSMLAWHSAFYRTAREARRA